MRSDPPRLARARARAVPLNRLPSITFLTDAFTVGTGGHQAGMRLKAGYGVSIHRTVNAHPIQLREICVFGLPERGPDKGPPLPWRGWRWFGGRPRVTDEIFRATGGGVFVTMHPLGV